LKIFIYPLIDKELLCRITDDVILWKIIKYLKHVCQEINKELENFTKFHKNGRFEVERIRWDFNLKDERTKWNEFCYNLLGNIVPYYPSKSDSIDSIFNSCISSNHVSFELNNRKFLIEIDERNQKAKLLINDKEYQNSTIKKNVIVSFYLV
jgi:hypothetical protein